MGSQSYNVVTKDDFTDVMDSTIDLQPMSKRQPYRYAPLSKSGPYIRLIRLLPRSHDGTLQLEMWNNVNLETWRAGSDSVQYHAVSYEWGDSQPTGQIYVDGATMSIRENLYLFLQALYEYHDGVGLGWLWIDALCIDQSNLAQRQHQVQLMKDVYGLATQVLAWLGPSRNEHDGDVFSICDWIREDFDSADLYGECILSQSLFQERYEPAGPLNILNNVSIVEALMQLCHRKYWTRLWVLQEVFLAKKVMFLCGAYKTLAQNFFGLINLRYLDDNIFFPPTDDCDQFLRFCQFYQVRVITDDLAIQDPTLLGLIQFLGDAECGILHDKVYGFLGMSHDGATVNADYLLPLEQCFINILQSAPCRAPLDGCYGLAKAWSILLEFDTAARLTVTTCSNRGSTLRMTHIAGDCSLVTDAKETPVQRQIVTLDNMRNYLQLHGYASHTSMYGDLLRPYISDYLSTTSTSRYVCKCAACLLCPPLASMSDRRFHRPMEQLNFYTVSPDFSLDTFIMCPPFIVIIFQNSLYAATIVCREKPDQAFILRDPFHSHWQIDGISPDGEREIFFDDPITSPNGTRKIIIDMPMMSVLFIVSHMFHPDLHLPEHTVGKLTYAFPT